MAKLIEVLIDEDGNVEVQTQGFPGASCKQATAELERALGKVTTDTVTADYYRAQPATLKARG